MLRLAVPLAAAALLVSAAAAAPPAITPSSIDGVKIGMSKAQVKALLGPSTVRHGTYDNPGQPDGWTALVFAKRMVAVYFDGTVDRAVMVTTWSPAARTAAGVGPCTSISRLKRVYRGTLEPSKHNLDPQGRAYAYTLGRTLMFGADGAPPTPSTTVTAVGLYDGTAGMQGYAGFVTDSEPNC